MQISKWAKAVTNFTNSYFAILPPRRRRKRRWEFQSFFCCCGFFIPPCFIIYSHLCAHTARSIKECVWNQLVAINNICETSDRLRKTSSSQHPTEIKDQHMRYGIRYGPRLLRAELRFVAPSYSRSTHGNHATCCCSSSCFIGGGGDYAPESQFSHRERETELWKLLLTNVLGPQIKKWKIVEEE